MRGFSFLYAVVLTIVPAGAVEADGFDKAHGRPPAGWARLDWPEKRKILFGQFAPTAEEKKAIDAALPTDLKRSADPPRVLMFYRCQYPHASIATGVYALEQLGKQTGAYEVTPTDDPAVFNPLKLREYDAVLLVHTTSYDKTIGPDGQAALTDYLEQGGGLAGIHAAADASQGWSFGARAIGGIFAGHPWRPVDTWAIKLESPNHPLNAAFKGKGFWLRDEVYVYRQGSFSRGRSRVLLSLDMSKENNFNSPKIPDAKRKQIEPGGDYPIAWVQEYSGGRIFYSNLGHTPATFREPAVLRHFLDGVLFATGRLEADATPSAELDDLLLGPAPERK